MVTEPIEPARRTHLIEVGPGQRVFVDDRGDAGSPALVFVHGGPGQGAYDFMRCQGDLLAASLRVVGIDQRGALRSDSLPHGAAVTAADIVSDLDVVRQVLGVDRWCVLGHSAGGAWALDYSLQHPEVVSGVVFDCPSWDAARTDRSRLPLLARLFEQRGNVVAARRCHQLLARPARLTAGDGVTGLRAELDDAPELMFAPTTPADAMEAIVASSGLDEQTWLRGMSHLALMPDLYRDRVPSLTGLSQPALLIRGAFDTVTTPDMVDAFTTTVPHATPLVLKNSGHLPYLEQPDEYAAAVIQFVVRSSQYHR